MNLNFFGDNRYREKIYSVTNLRILSFEIYKLFLLYVYFFIIQKISKYLPFRIFFEIDSNFNSFIKIFAYLLIIDICYYVLFKTNTGIKSLHELLLNIIFYPDILKLITLILLFSIIYLCTSAFKSLMIRLDIEYISKRYNMEEEDYDEDYYRYYKYNYSNFILTLCFSFIILLYLIFQIQKFENWSKICLTRINNFKSKLRIMFKNMIIISLPAFIVIYIFLIFFYRTIFVFDLSFNYTSLFIIEINIIFMSINSLNNFISAPINFITNEINTFDKLIKKEINFMKEENFYVCHYLQNIRDLYEYPRDNKFNTLMLNFDNLKLLQKKINYFINAINSKYNSSYNKRNYFYNNQYSDLTDKIKYYFEKCFDFFDYSLNQILQNDTSILNLKLIIEILGNILLFISDAQINKSNDEKYKDCKDFSYYFMEKLIDLDEIFVNLLQNKGISDNLKNNIQKLRYLIKNNFDLIRNRQYKNKFLILMPQKIEAIINGSKIY